MFLLSRRAGMAAWVAGMAFALLTASAPAPPPTATGMHCTSYTYLCSAPASAPDCVLCANGCGLPTPDYACAPAYQYKMIALGICVACTHVPGHFCSERPMVCVRQRYCYVTETTGGFYECLWTKWSIYASATGCIATTTAQGGLDNPVDFSPTKLSPEVSM